MALRRRHLCKMWLHQAGRTGADKRGILAGHTETAEGDHRLYTGKQKPSHPLKSSNFTTSLLKAFAWWNRQFPIIKISFVSNRGALRKSALSSSPEPQLQRRRCRSCRNILTSTWAGQEVAWCVSHMFTIRGVVMSSFTFTSLPAGINRRSHISAGCME